MLISREFVEFWQAAVHAIDTRLDVLRRVRINGDSRHRATVEMCNAAFHPISEVGLTTRAGDARVRSGAGGENAVDGAPLERVLRSIELGESENQPRGIFILSPEQTDEIIEKCMRHGVQMNLRANGAAASDRDPSAIECVQKLVPAPKSSRVCHLRSECLLWFRRSIFPPHVFGSMSPRP